MRDKHLVLLKLKESEETEKRKIEKEKEEKVSKFYSGLKADTTKDLRDKLDDLA